MEDHYTPEQREAVFFGDGVMELVAGPGSGKTFVVTGRIRELIRTHKVPADRILVITFTRAAAEEMKRRFMKLYGWEGGAVAFGTFHSVFYHILRSHADFRNLKPVPDRVRRNYLSDILKRRGLSAVTGDGDLFMLLEGAVSRVKNEGSIPDDMTLPVDREAFQGIVAEYNTALTENGFLDFDDMLLLCRNELVRDREFREKWQSRFSHILIDEFQDICMMQYETVKLLAAPENNLFVVGDDDQSIYGFRGARVEVMDRFVRDFPECRRLCMSVNFRSGKDIIEASSKVISLNKQRIGKTITSGRKLQGEVTYHRCSSVEEEKKTLIELLKTYGEENTAVLCRKNRHCREVASILSSSGINCRMKDPFRSRFDWFFVRDMLAYMECASAGELRRDKMLRIINRPVRYIRRGAFQNESVDRRAVAGYYSGNPEMQRTVERLFSDLERISRMNPFLAVNYIRKVMGYDVWAQQQMDPEGKHDYLERAEAFQKECLEAGCLEKVREMVENDIRETKELNRNNENSTGPGVRIMTFHGSKGLEFDKVILPFVNEGAVPPRQSHSTEELEEERRMLYVAMTRAKSELMIIYADSEKDTPSRFIRCLIDPYGRSDKWNSLHQSSGSLSSVLK
ncbi:MAG: ATP-dependent helicase [Lachnospiraceae bacterium]|nr:ATP-dependent helicase [Lachnospiraceae bacterium]